MMPEDQPHADAAAEGCPNAAPRVSTPLSGRCEMPARGKNSKNGRCTRNGALREQETPLGKARSMICDHHTALLESHKVKLRTVKADELL